MLRGSNLENLLRNNIHGIKTTKSQFYLNGNFDKKYPLLVIKAYLLMMIIMFFSVAYNRFIYFVLIGILLLSIFIIFKIRLDHIFKTKLTQKVVHYILLLVIAGVITYFFKELTYYHTDVDSAGYFISLIVQSEAAIIAIVVTLSLVAVQQASSSYSARVINIFKDRRRNPDFFILMITYAICIIYGAYLAKIIKTPNLGNQIYTIVDPSFETYIWILYASFIFSLLALGSYILDTLEMFKPSILIKLLSENISREAIESAIKLENSNNVDERGEIQPVNDTIQPIIDVLQGSMMAYDYETTKYGLRIVENKAIQILKDKNHDLTCKEAIANRVIDYIKIVGIIAVRQEMERTAIDASHTLFNIGKVLIEEGLHNPIPLIIDSLKKIGRDSSTKDNLLDSSVQTIDNLQKIGKMMIENNEKNIVKKTINSIGEIGIGYITPQYNEPPVLIEHIIKILKEFGEEVTEKKWGIETGVVITNLGTIGLKIIENERITGDIENLERRVLISLYSIFEVAIDQDLENPVYGITSTIRNIGVKASDKNPSLVKEAKVYLGYIHTALSPRCLDVVPENLWIKLCKHTSRCEKDLENLIEPIPKPVLFPNSESFKIIFRY
ncbi:hypothetical protein FXV91_12980 [Methanosarcina sp. DH2]|uniref:DUF2254 family protein n=1 Tax=Methanosarcina sp. DH2 TaxID=2605639 RepID=UPI001E5A8E8B|nr:DUF2254 family protein [Methanosarcina sp. DH2]MCC4771046.1 hypothetical protein [Methanosarcina sp. DH2]